ncbi:MAG: 3D domain-containing protein [bacterium]|nr:3D domain-containing protein [bacterium]
MRVSIWPLSAAVFLLLMVGSAVAADNGKQVNVLLANETIPLTSRAQTVGAFLDELSITGGDATVEPPANSALRDGMDVRLQGVTVSRGTTERAVPVQVQFFKSFRHGPEEMLVADPGQEGRVATTYTIFSSNGIEIGRRSSDLVLQPMRPKQVVCCVPLSESEDGPSVQQILAERTLPGSWHQPPARYKRSLTMNSSAYEPGPVSCGRYADGYTCNGTKADYGVVATDTKVIPLGTRLFIEGYGYAVAADRGGAIDGNDIDLCYRTVAECFKWGRKKVKVYILY